MQRILLSFFALFLAFAFPVYDAEAKRMGGGKSSGMQRDTPMKRDASPQQAQNTPAAPGQNAAAAGTPKRNWMGPLAGLAAGLGIAALLSHFGLGEGMANILLMALLAFAAFMLVRWFMNRNKAATQSPLQYAASGAPNQLSGHQLPGNQLPGHQPASNQPASQQSSLFERMGGNSVLPGSVADQSSPMAAASGAARVAAAFPPGFDVEAFTRQAKVNFIRMQTANDAGNLADLREFTTPEMYAELKLDIDERNGKEQRTEVMMLNAETLEAVEEGNRQIVSVRFYGTLREDGATTIPFDEIWHLSKPSTGKQGWLVAGIQQNEQNQADNQNSLDD